MARGCDLPEDLLCDADGMIDKLKMQNDGQQATRTAHLNSYRRKVIAEVSALTHASLSPPALSSDFVTHHKDG